MRLSKLQKYILTSFYLNKSNFKVKQDFYSFYPKETLAKNKKIIQDIIHKSLENLVSKDLLVAFGKKTAEKWYIDKVKITSRGRHLAVKIIKNRQRRLPIK